MKAKRLHNILRCIVCTIIGAYILLLAILNFGPTERILTQIVATELSQTLHTNVSIGKIEIGLFNRIIINDICIKDKQGNKLIKAQIATAKIELRSLFKEQLSLRTVSLIDTDINLYKQRADSAANYQFLLDAFTSKDTKKESTLNLRINSIILRRVAIKYNEWYKPHHTNQLDPSHLSVNQLNANISLKSIKSDSLSLRIRSLSFNEQSGLCLKKLRFKLNASRTTAHIEDFRFEMPHTRISQSDLIATYDIRKGFDQLLPTLRIGATIDNLQIGTSDIRPLLKLPRQFDQTLQLSTTLLLTPDKFQLNQLTLTNTEHTLLIKANATLQRKAKQIEALHLSLKQLQAKSCLTQLFATSFIPQNQQLVNLLQRVGNIDASGNTFYNFSRNIGTASVFLHSEVGSIAADAQLRERIINANIHLSQLQLDHILNNTKLPTQITTDTHIQANLTHKMKPIILCDGSITSMQYNSHTVLPINYRVCYSKDNILANINSSDPIANLELSTKLSIKNKKINQIKLSANVQRFDAKILGINNAFAKAIYSGNIQANLSQLSTNMPHGEVELKQFNITDGPHGNYNLQQLQASLYNCSNNKQQFCINSDFIDAKITGQLTPKKIQNGIQCIINKCLPGLMPRPQQMAAKDEEWNINAHLKQSEAFEKLFGINVSVQEGLHVQGTVNAGSGRTSLSVFANQIDVVGQSFTRPSIYLSGTDSLYHCLIQAHKKLSGREYSIAADLSTANGKLTTQLAWNGVNERDYNGTFESITQFYPTKHGVNFNMHIRPTQFALADTTWNIASGQLSYINRHLAFSGVKLSHNNQSLQIDGEIAPNKNDSIVAQLHDLDIDYILGLINFDAVSFGGKATGQAIFTQKGNTPQLHAHLLIPNFTFNNGLMGAADIKANWNKEENRINIDADMKLPNTPNYGTNVQGYVSLAEKGLNLDIAANHTRLDFLKRYIDGIFGDFTGNATGNVCLYGPFKQLDFKGEVKANCKARVLATCVDYEVKDGNVTMSTGKFAFKNFTLTDKKGGKGIANGELRHTHLKKLNYDFDITADHLLCYDQPQQPNLPFYSTTIGSGKVHLQGWPNHFVANIALTPNAPTLFVYNLGTQSALSKDDHMIRFHAINNEQQTAYNTPADRSSVAEVVASSDKDDPGTDMLLNFNINMTPQAQIRIITDERSDDAITAYGQGALRATWHNKGGFNLYGRYTLSRGEYNISIQDIIRKSLTLQPGSSITFAGDPLYADLALKALYTVNSVSLNDLNYGAGFSNKTVRADCILNIGGKAHSPQVNFDLDLHNISEDEKHMVRQLISTEENMSRQAMYLLGIGRFMTTSQGINNVTSTSSQQSSAAMRSFLSTTITGQLNSAISSMLGNQSKWSFGTNFTPGTDGWNSLEVDGLLQGRLFNDRLLINGNFGYRDNPYYTSNFIGDFDIRYLLTPRGSISLRAYSETNDRYFTKSSLTTQGVGILLQREFTRMSDLFRRKYRKTSKKTKSEKVGIVE